MDLALGHACIFSGDSKSLGVINMDAISFRSHPANKFWNSSWTLTQAASSAAIRVAVSSDCSAFVRTAHFAFAVRAGFAIAKRAGLFGCSSGTAGAAGVRAVDKCCCHQVSLNRDRGKTILLCSCLTNPAGSATNVAVAVRVLLPLRMADSSRSRAIS